MPPLFIYLLKSRQTNTVAHTRCGFDGMVESDATKGAGRGLKTGSPSLELGEGLGVGAGQRGATFSD